MASVIGSTRIILLPTVNHSRRDEYRFLRTTRDLYSNKITKHDNIMLSFLIKNKEEEEWGREKTYCSSYFTPKIPFDEKKEKGPMLLFFIILPNMEWKFWTRRLENIQ